MDASHGAAAGFAPDGSDDAAEPGFGDAQSDAAAVRQDATVHEPTAAADAGTTDAGDGNTVGPADPTSVVASWTCTGNYEFRATAIAFSAPTPPRLANAFTALSKDVNSLSLVLHAKNDGLLGALSGTVTSSNDIGSFPSNELPPFAPAIPAFSAPPGVTTADAQPIAFLRLRDDSGPVTIQIEHVVWRADEDSDCSHLTISFQAVIPPSQLPVLLHLPAGTRSLGELVTALDAGPVIPVTNPAVDASTVATPVEVMTPVELRGAFQGTPAAFDFNTL